MRPELITVLDRQSELPTDVFTLLIDRNVTTATRATDDLPAVRRTDEPLVVREAREYIERAFTNSTAYGGTRLKASPSWKLVSSPGAMLFTSGSDETTDQLVCWGLSTNLSASSHMEAVQLIKLATGLSMERVAKLLGVSRQALNLWRHDRPISDEKRRRLLAVHEVLERAAVRYRTRDALLTWLDTPRGAEGLTPAQLLERGEIGRARTLAVSSPSPNVLRLSLARRPIPDALRAGAERPPEAVPPDRDHEFAALADDEEGEDVETVLED